ncbi:MAG: OsmC family protein [Chloroflexota bacterium]
MDATVVLQDGMRFVATADSGHQVIMDSDGSVGGTDTGSRPMELIAMGLGGCTAMDVISILRKKRQDVTGFEVKVHGDRAEEHPKVFTNIVIEYVLTGHDIDPAAVERAIQLSAERYCPAQAMLNQVVPLELTYRIIEAS